MMIDVKPRPDQVRAAKDTIERAVQSCKHTLKKDEDIEFHLAWEGRPEVLSQLGGAQGRAMYSDLITISFNAKRDDWKDALMRVTAHEYAHAFFYEENDLSDFVWQRVLEEALAIHHTRHTFPELDNPQLGENSAEVLEEHWVDAREALSDETDYDHQIFIGGEDFPKWYGHDLALQIGKELLDRHDYEDLPHLNRTEVLEIGDTLFG